MTVLTLLIVLVAIPAGIGYCLYTEYLSEDFHPPVLFAIRDFIRRFLRNQLEPGDFLIYRKPKVSVRPGPRARNVQAAEKGDDYYYEVDKFWTVADILDDGRLIAVTRTGKQHTLTPRDENLRKASLLERMRFRRRFPSV
jgi:hypothetical protein